MLERLMPPAALALTLVLAASTADAGPPAVCHPIATRAPISMPWGGWMSWGRAGWKNIDRSIEPDVAVARALEALRATDDTFAHMEIVRRAVVYIYGDGKDGPGRRKRGATAEAFVRSLRDDLDKMLRSADEDPKLRRLAALRRFDVAYAAAGLDQMGILTTHGWFADVDVDFHAELKKALEIRPNDGPMHLGAALGLWMGPADEREVYQYLKIALRSADDDELLEKNLLSTAGPFLGTKTLEGFRREVRRKLGRS